MNHRTTSAVFLIVTIFARAAHADEIRRCKFEVKTRCASGDVTVTLADGVVKRLEINAFWCGLKGRPGYTCTVDSARGDDTDATWKDEDGATVITNATPFDATHPDRIKVTVGKYVSVDMAETQSAGRCGAGADLPRAIVIPEKKGACRVWLDPP